LGREGAANDWSVTAWGEDAEVQVEVIGKGETKRLPSVEKDDSKLPEDEGGDGNTNPNDALAIAAAEKAEDFSAEA
jgi:hypothetical protein